MLSFAPVCKGAIISQLRVWPFPFAIIVTIGERSQNPGHLFTGAFNCTKICLKSLTYHNTDICHYLHERVRFIDHLKTLGYTYAFAIDIMLTDLNQSISVSISLTLCSLISSYHLFHKQGIIFV